MARTNPNSSVSANLVAGGALMPAATAPRAGTTFCWLAVGEVVGGADSDA
jgi:hypothetical protein